MRTLTESKGGRVVLWLVGLSVVLLAFLFDPTSGRLSLPGVAVIALVVLTTRYYLQKRARNDAEQAMNNLEAELGRARNRTTVKYSKVRANHHDFGLALTRAAEVLQRIRSRAFHLTSNARSTRPSDWEHLLEASSALIRQLHDAAYWAEQDLSVRPGMLSPSWSFAYNLDVPEVTHLPPSPDGLKLRNVPGEWYWGVDPQHVNRPMPEHEAKPSTTVTTECKVPVLANYRRGKVRTKPNGPGSVIQFPKGRGKRRSD